MSSPNDVTLYHEVAKCIDTIGYEPTLKALRSARKQLSFLEDKNALFVMGFISEEFDISINDIVLSRSRSDSRGLALSFAVYLIREYHDHKIYSFAFIGRLFNRDKSFAHISWKRIKYISLETDRFFWNKKQKFDEIMRKRQQENNTTKDK
jgi:hypothetical protein